MLSNLQSVFLFVTPGFRRFHPFKVFKLILFFSFFVFFWFVYSMARGEEGTSTSQDGCKRGAPRESPTITSLVATMSVEELRSFCQDTADVRL